MTDARASAFLASLLLAAGLLSACGQRPATAEAETGAEGAATAVEVESLPLKRGFYVSTDTPCGEASNATLSLVTRDGVNGARTVCTFTRIERIGADAYRVTSACADIQGGEPPEASVDVYTLAGDSGFVMTTEYGWETSARYCPQPSLPEPWRDNDISDIAG